MAVFEYETLLPCSVEGLFDFLRRPHNVARVSRPELGITFQSAPDVVEHGSQLNFQMITFGQVIRASHLITEIAPPKVIVEQQVTGPMRSWLHRHEYAPSPDGAVMRDIVEFQLPGGIIGMLLSESKVKDHLEDGFYFREQKLRELIRAGEVQ